MANLKNLLDDIKKDLAKAQPKSRPPTVKQILEGAAADIHAHLKQGARLDDVYLIIRARLPEDTKLSLNTFKKYWREARETAGLSKIKNSGRKKKEENTSIEKRMIHVVTREAGAKITDRNTESDFREDPDNV